MYNRNEEKPYSNHNENPTIRVGISSCLLGMNVRFDGGHKHDSYLTETLGRYFEWVSVCPEVEMGMSTPRENIRLKGTVEDPSLIAPKSGTDYTDGMKAFSERRLQELADMDLHGYILKKDSPSCGMERVRVYDENNIPRRQGVGIYARALLEKFPLLPVEEEGRLKDARLRENFIERIYAHYRLQQLLRSDPKPKDLVAFHTNHKLTLMSHSQKSYRELGKMIADVGKADRSAFVLSYMQTFMEALKRKATTRTHTNVLYHMIGFFKKHLDARDRKELVDIIEQYHSGIVPLIVPIVLIKHHLNRYDVDWLRTQIYLNPYPGELRLRNLI